MIYHRWGLRNRNCRTNIMQGCEETCQPTGPERDGRIEDFPMSFLQISCKILQQLIRKVWSVVTEMICWSIQEGLLHISTHPARCCLTWMLQLWPSLNFERCLGSLATQDSLSPFVQYLSAGVGGRVVSAQRLTTRLRFESPKRRGFESHHQSQMALRAGHPDPSARVRRVNGCSPQPSSPAHSPVG